MVSRENFFYSLCTIIIPSFFVFSYVQACYRTLLDDSLELDQFAKELLPSIINLSEDKTPNVRVAVALLFSQCLLPLGMFISNIIIILLFLSICETNIILFCRILH